MPKRREEEDAAAREADSQDGFIFAAFAVVGSFVASRYDASGSIGFSVVVEGKHDGGAVGCSRSWPTDEYVIVM